MSVLNLGVSCVKSSQSTLEFVIPLLIILDISFDESTNKIESTKSDKSRPIRTVLLPFRS